jgi:hypothetical protein
MSVFWIQEQTCRKEQTKDKEEPRWKMKPQANAHAKE